MTKSDEVLRHLYSYRVCGRLHWYKKVPKVLLCHNAIMFLQSHPFFLLVPLSSYSPVVLPSDFPCLITSFSQYNSLRCVMSKNFLHGIVFHIKITQLQMLHSSDKFSIVSTIEAISESCVMIIQILSAKIECTDCFNKLLAATSKFDVASSKIITSGFFTIILVLQRTF